MNFETFAFILLVEKIGK